VGSKNISSLLSGGFIGVLPAPKIRNTDKPNILPNEEAQPEAFVAAQTHFMAENIPPIVEALPYGLNLKLVAENRGSVRVGNPVLYRQIKVGTVIGIGLADTADKVNVFININKHFIPLVTTQSRFWNTSGITIKGGLINGIDIHSESVETLLAGGIAFATPENKNKQAKGVQSTNGNVFYLYGELDQDWLEWQPKIQLKSL
jgi:paraquat-inducible protein B